MAFKFLFLSILIPSLSFAGGSTSVGPGSPASHHCQRVGGSILTIDKNQWGGDQLGICSFSENGMTSMIHEWSLSPRSQAASEFLRNDFGRSNDRLEVRASTFCIKLGGQIVAYVDHLRPTIGFEMCEFKDKSSIEVWTLYNGTHYSPILANILRQLKIKLLRREK